MNEDRNMMNLRVFKRNAQYLVLLWDKVDGVNERDTEILITRVTKKDDGSYTPQDKERKIDGFYLGSAVPKECDLSSLRNRKKPAVICGVNETDCDMDPYAYYEAVVTYGDRTQKILVLPSGMLPDEWREDKHKNVHLLGWSDEEGKWMKIGVTKTKDGIALLVKTVKE